MRATLRSILFSTFGIVLLCAAAPAAAQTGTVTGTVTDSASGTPLPGVQVVLAGARFGAVTGDNGRYVIANVAPGTYAIEARRIGYSPRQQAGVRVVADSTTTVDVRLHAATLRLQQQVITGVVDPTQGTRAPFTVGRVSADEAPVPALNPVETLQGKVAGVSTTSSGQPGSATNIVLRTPTSISKSSEPLYVVDGVILSQTTPGSTADLNALDIESIEVVKGAAAASLYGSRAANGVVQIRTKRGAGLAPGKTRVTARSEFGTNSLTNEIDWSQYHAYRMNDAGQYVNDSGRVVGRAERVSRPASERFQDQRYADPTFNQVDRFFNPGQFSTNTVSIAQNNANTNWFASFSNQRTDGVILQSGGYDRSDARLNLDHSLRDDLRFSVSGYYSRSKRDDLYDDTFFDLIFQPPDVDLRQPDPDGTRFIYIADPAAGEENPLYVLETEQRTTQRTRFLGSADLRFSPFSWVNLDGNVSYDRSDRSRTFFLDRGKKTEGYAEGGVGEVGRLNGAANALNASVSANFLQRFGKLTARTTLRGLIEREENNLSEAEGVDLAVAGVPDLDNARQRSIESSFSGIRSNGYFALTGFDYDGRYIGDALVRRDGSSLFGPDERWHTYYRVSGAYRMAQESWWPWKSINEFKLRASRGTAGGRPDFADQFETYEITDAGGLVKETLGNRQLKPELATEDEVGVDVIVRDRYSLQLSYARNKVEDQLLRAPLPSAFGYQEQWRNAGTVEGNTYEATLEAQLVNRPNVSWRLGLVADRARHKITQFDLPCYTDLTVAYRCEGEALGTMYGLQFLGDRGQLPAVHAGSRDQFDVNDDGLLVPVGPGGSWRDGQWGTTVTIDGVNYAWGMPIQLRSADGQAAVVRIGSSTPDFRFGVSNNVRWKNLTLFGLVDAQVGGQVYNRTKQRMYQYARHGDVDQAGKPQDEKKPTDYYLNLYSANDVTSWFVEPGGFAKLRELSATYRLPATQVRFLSRAGIEGVSLSLIGRNLLTFTNYSGYDPEVGAANPDDPTAINSAVLRLDNFTYPQFRTFTGSIQLEF